MELNTCNLEIDHLVFNKISDYVVNTDNINLGLLNFKKESFNIIEKFVYDVVSYHFNNLNLNLNDDYYIEFWIKNKTTYINDLHIDCDENLRKENKFNYPILSCVTYFEDSNYPFVLTDIDLENYKYKNFNDSKKLHLIFPRKLQHVSFNPIYYHGAINILDDEINKNRPLLAINIWSSKLNTNYSNIDMANDYCKDDPILSLVKNNNINNYHLEDDLLNFNFYETLLYNTDNIKNSFPDVLINYIKEKLDYNVHSFTFNNPIKSEIFNLIKYKTSIENIEVSKKNIYEIQNLDKDSLVYNRFLQRFTFQKTYSSDICTWIINEAELHAKNNNGWTTTRHTKYPTTDLPIEKITAINGFIFSSLNNIFNKITKAYCLPNDTNYNILDFFIVKYNENFQNELELHTDGSFITFNILLSDTKDFEGGGTFFSDGITSYLEQGDMIVHSGKIKHAGLPITKGTRYVLVAFISIDNFL
jgi:hypothetical protein